MRCTQATLEAFGIYGKCPTYGTGVIDAIREAGYKYRVVEGLLTVGQVKKKYKIGMFYLSGKNHAMALVDSVLTDTANGGDKRKVDVIEIYR